MTEKKFEPQFMDFHDELSRSVMEKRYFWKDENGNPVEGWREMCSRVAKAVASAEDDHEKRGTYEVQFFNMMYRGDFLPNSPVLMNFGQPGALGSACFVLPIDDDMGSIFETLKNTALIHRDGGGTGFNFSRLRPFGAKVKTSGKSSGVVSFMSIYNAAGMVIEQGGCIDINSMVSTEHGLVKLASLMNSSALTDTPMNKLVMGMDGFTGGRLSIDNGMSKVIRLTTKDGYFIQATPNHMVRVVDNSGTLGWRRADEVRVGDYLVVKLGCHLGEPQDLTEPDYTHHNMKRISLPAYIDEDFAEFVGYYLANGCVNGRRLVLSMPTSSGDTIQYFKEKLFRYGLNPVCYQKDGDNSINMFINSAPLVQCMKKNQLIKDGAINASVPSKIFQSPSDVVYAFLRGFFSGDGTWSTSGYPSISSISINLISDMQILMASVGIASSVYESNSRMSSFGDNTIYTLQITHPDGLEIFRDKIGFLCASKNDKMESHGTIDNTRCGRSIPFFDKILARHYKPTGRGRKNGSIPPDVSKEFARYLRGERSPTRVRVEYLVENGLLPDTIMGEELLSKHIAFCAVKSIREDQAYTGDIETISSEYVANGICIHNKRRGANMGLLNIDHPEIIKFIRAKEEDGKLANFNLSVVITDKFMTGMNLDPNTIMTCYHESTGICWLDHDGGWHPLSSENPPASAVRMGELFDMVVEHAWSNGEPGVVFIDRAQEKNPVKHLGTITGCNPCGEYYSISYSSCNLGSINLSNFVSNGAIDNDRLMETVALATRFLDDVIDVNTYPIEEIGEVTRSTRPVGCGVMGFADMLLKLGIRYGSDESVEVARSVMKLITDVSHAESIQLAKERGEYPASKGDPKRNCQTTTIAPTGTISMLAGCSSGIEPVFSWGYERRAAGDTTTVKHPLVTLDELRDPSLLPKHYVTAKDISVEEHIKVQAAFQKHCDNGVSKTVNMPYSASKEDVANAIKMAYTMNCNGITIYRDGSRTNQVLEEKKQNEPETIALPEPIPEEPLAGRGVVVDRPRITDGSTGCYRTGCGIAYITMNHINGEPCEVFINSSDGGGCAASSKAIGMLISLGLRAGIAKHEIINTLKKVHCPACIGKKHVDGKSCAAIVAKAMLELSPSPGDFYADDLSLTCGNTCDDVSRCLSVAVDCDCAYHCPDCGAPMIRESGCVSCKECGFTRCG